MKSSTINKILCSCCLFFFVFAILGTYSIFISDIRIECPTDSCVPVVYNTDYNQLCTQYQCYCPSSPHHHSHRQQQFYINENEIQCEPIQIHANYCYYLAILFYIIATISFKISFVFCCLKCCYQEVNEYKKVSVIEGIPISKDIN